MRSESERRSPEAACATPDRPDSIGHSQVNTEHCHSVLCHLRFVLGMWRISNPIPSLFHKSESVGFADPLSSLFGFDFRFGPIWSTAVCWQSDTDH